MQLGRAAPLLAAILAVTFVLYQVYSVRQEMTNMQKSDVKLFKDIETKLLAASKKSERAEAKSKEVLKKVKQSKETTPEASSQPPPLKSGKSNSETILDTLAVVRDFVHNFDSSEIPKEVRKWYTYTARDVAVVNNLDQEDPTLLQYIRDQVLIPPAPKTAQYQLKEPNKTDPSQGQTARILEIFKNKTKGTFIECGALDGEFFSNTLTLERDLGWSGVLIEADPVNFKNMLGRNRKSWLVPACLSLKKTPQMVAFAKNTFSLGKIATEKEMSAPKSDQKFFDIQCLPLTAILLALNKTSVDYFSLDIEGHELDVLRTIDFKKIDIKVLVVEFSHGKEPKENMKKHMEENGYRVYKTNDSWAIENYMFIQEKSGL